MQVTTTLGLSRMLPKTLFNLVSLLFNVGKIQFPPDFSRVALIKGQIDSFRCTTQSVQVGSYRHYIHNGTMLENVAKSSKNIWTIKNICEQIISVLKSFSYNDFLKTKF